MTWAPIALAGAVPWRKVVSASEPRRHSQGYEVDLVLECGHSVTCCVSLAKQRRNFKCFACDSEAQRARREQRTW